VTFLQSGGGVERSPHPEGSVRDCAIFVLDGVATMLANDAQKVIDDLHRKIGQFTCRLEVIHRVKDSASL
jgi:hypothetical protein